MAVSINKSQLNSIMAKLPADVRKAIAKLKPEEKNKIKAQLEKLIETGFDVKQGKLVAPGDFGKRVKSPLTALRKLIPGSKTDITLADVKSAVRSAKLPKFADRPVASTRANATAGSNGSSGSATLPPQDNGLSDVFADLKKPAKDKSGKDIPYGLDAETWSAISDMPDGPAKKEAIANARVSAISRRVQSLSQMIQSLNEMAMAVIRNIRP